MSKNRRPGNRRKQRVVLWRVTQHGREISRGEHHDMLRMYLGLRYAMPGLDLELVR